MYANGVGTRAFGPHAGETPALPVRPDQQSVAHPTPPTPPDAQSTLTGRGGKMHHRPRLVSQAARRGSRLAAMWGGRAPTRGDARRRQCRKEGR